MLNVKKKPKNPTISHPSPPRPASSQKGMIEGKRGLDSGRLHNGMPLISDAEFLRLHQIQSTKETVATFDFQGYVERDGRIEYRDVLVTNGLRGGISVSFRGTEQAPPERQPKGPSDIQDYPIYVKIPSETLRSEGLVAGVADVGDNVETVAKFRKRKSKSGFDEEEILEMIAEGQRKDGWVVATPSTTARDKLRMLALAINDYIQRGRPLENLQKFIYTADARLEEEELEEETAAQDEESRPALPCETVRTEEPMGVSAAYEKHEREAMFADVWDAVVNIDHAKLLRLLREGASLEIRDSEGNTPLMLAAKIGRLSAVEMLLEYGAEVDARDKEGQTPLMLAARSSSFYWGHESATKIAAVLIGYGADVNAVKDNGRTALMFACDARNIELVLLLVENGADVTAETKPFPSGRVESVLDCAILELIQETAENLMNPGTTQKCEGKEITVMLLKLGAKPKCTVLPADLC